MAHAPPPQLQARDVVLGLSGAVARLGAATTMIGGSVAFAVSGEAGGRWRLDLSVPGGRCFESDDQKAATTVHATPAGLVGMFLRPASVTKLCADGQLRVEGDPKPLQKLANMLRQTRSWVER